MYQYAGKQNRKQNGEQNKKMPDLRQYRGMQTGPAASDGMGLSPELKEKYETLSGYSFDDVKVHYNSSKPAKMQALAYTQGNQVYLMPGQERHLEHELGHVVQQKKGIVKPTGTIGGIPVNDDETLETEAGMYGEKAYGAFPGEQDLQRGYGGLYGGLVVQRYKKAGGYTLAAAPEHAPNERLLMVKDNEPGALYIHTAAADAQVPGELGRLGILPSGIQVESPLPNETPEGQFQRYEQGRIPEIIDREPIQQVIPWRRRTMFQKICSIFKYPTETIYRPQKVNQQPDRAAADRELAEARLEMQREFLQSCLDDGTGLRDHIQGQAQPPQEPVERWAGKLRELLGAEEAEEAEKVEKFIAYNALGSDVRKDVKTIHGTAVQGQEQAEDRLRALEIAMEDLQYRLAQVEREMGTVNLMPQLPTACNTSASVRSMLINGVGNDNGSAKADFAFEGLDGGENPFNDIVDWSYHFATPIPADSLTSDMLMIEDAVGKSSGGKEVMNAHWSAHVYGKEEGGEGQGIPLDSLQPAGAGQGAFRGVSRCRFNQMSDLFRQSFFGRNGIGQNHSWSMEYKDYSTGIVYGTLKFYLDENWRVAYELEPRPGRNFTPGMKHFLISTADAIAEDFVLTNFAGEDDEGLLGNDRGIRIRQSPKTRYDMGNYSLEDFQMV